MGGLNLLDIERICFLIRILVLLPAMCKNRGV